MTRCLFLAFFLLCLGFAQAQAPVNLALGKKVIYAVPPDKPTDPDCTKLTDGKINLPPKTSGKKADSEYFDERRQNYSGRETMQDKLTVGWHWQGSKDTEYGLALAVDLEQPRVLSRVKLRASSFTRFMYRFSLPREVVAVASLDGQSFFRIGCVCKTTSEAPEDLPADAALLKVRENRNQWCTFEIDSEGVEARYVGLIIKAEGFMFYCDEFEVLSGVSRNEARNEALYAPKNRERFAIGHGLAPKDEVVFCPYDGELVIPEDGVYAPMLLYFRDFRTGKVKREYTFLMTLPAGADLVRSHLLTSEFTVTSNRNTDGSQTLSLVPKRHAYPKNLGNLLGKKVLGPIYFTTTGALAKDALATFQVRVGENAYTPVTVPVRTLKFPTAKPGRQPFSASITWMPEVYALDWPDFLKTYSLCGFNGVAIFPYQWRHLQKADKETFNPEYMKAFAERIRQAGLDVIQVEAALHAIVWRKPEPCTYPGAKNFCMSYRGERLQQHLEDLKNASAVLKPSMVLWDIELVGASFGGNIKNILKCERCAQGVKESGLGVREYLEKCGDEIYRLLRKAHCDGAGYSPRFGQYDVFAGQQKLLKHAYHHVWRFDENYPEVLDLSMPALYSAGLFDVNHNRVRDQYRLIGKNWVTSCWVTPGVYGYCTPKKMEHLVYEHILNGGNLMVYSIYEFRTPRQLYYFARGFQTLGRYTELIREGAPDLSFAVDNKNVAVTRFASQKEALFFIANYSSPDTETVTLSLPEGSVVASSSRDVSVRAGANTLKLAPTDFILIHTPLSAQAK